MKMRSLMAAILFCLTASPLFAQLTVEKIMRDPKWIGSSPSNPFWSWDSKQLYFGWNPNNGVSDSNYRVTLNSNRPVKAGYIETLKEQAISNGVWNSNNTQLAYAYRGDIFLLDIKSNQTIRVTKTEETESNPRFVGNNEWLVYTKNQNLFGWNIRTGASQQLSNLTRSTEGQGISGMAGMGVGFRGERTVGTGGGSGLGGNAATGGRIQLAGTQDQWLQQNQLALSQILQERKKKKEAQDIFLKNNKDADTLKTIGIGDKQVQNLQISPNGRFISYRLYSAPAPSRNTIVPDYLNESGYTTDISGRTKVGNPLGRFETWIYDREKESVYQITTDSLPGITDVPDYVKDYPQKYNGRKLVPRPVVIVGPIWNDAGQSAIVDIRSQDNKDRWICSVQPENGRLTLIDHQRDEAWIGGPGIGGAGYGTNIGWISEDQIYYQTEKTGYSHINIYNIKAGAGKAITSGNYEVQNLVLSKNKQLFYLLTNEIHPGKSHWYRMKTDGTQKEKITGPDGGYEISLSPDEKYIAFRYSYINQPWELYLQENGPGKKPIQLTDKAASPEFKSYSWRDTKIFTIPARDGKQIYSRIYEPKPGTENHAAVIFVHGAGYLQNVHYGWSSYFREQMFNNLLADKGYTVIDIDYRASSGYGRDWRTGIYRFMGGKDLDDEEDAAKWLVQNKNIDAGKIGMYGGSYGGFMTLMALFTKPDLFKAGAALRPVTDWAHYNHGYTSNILNEPINDSIAYARSSPLNFAGGLKNHLLICHGMVDVNVHFQDAVRLNQRLIELGKDNWEMAVYPVEDHGFVEPSSWTDEYKRILRLFEKELR